MAAGVLPWPALTAAAPWPLACGGACLLSFALGAGFLRAGPCTTVQPPLSSAIAPLDEASVETRGVVVGRVCSLRLGRPLGRRRSASLGLSSASVFSVFGAKGLL